VALVGDALYSKKILNFEVASYNFELNKSTIEGAGRGLFKVVRVLAGTKIGRFYGIFVAEDKETITHLVPLDTGG